MTTPDEQSKLPALPASILSGLAGVPKALVPASVKALDRLIGAGIDIPVAWLAQQKARIDAKTQAYTAVEAAIAKSAASEAGGNPAIVERAVNFLVSKSYRQQANREAVSVAMIEDLTNPAVSEREPATTKTKDHPVSLDDDWLNVFERYAEDASTERMQKLWGRVLAGEVRTPGKYSMRTLRFLSEFSQADALSFSDFCASSFSDFAPKALVKPDDLRDLRSLIHLEAAGLIHGASGIGLSLTLTFRSDGNVFLREGPLAIMFSGQPEGKVTIAGLTLTPLGQELVTLLPGRDAKAAAKAVAMAMRSPDIKSAYLVTVNNEGNAIPMEVLWQEEVPAEENNSEPQ